MDANHYMGAAQYFNYSVYGNGQQNMYTSQMLTNQWYLSNLHPIYTQSYGDSAGSVAMGDAQAAQMTVGQSSTSVVNRSNTTQKGNVLLGNPKAPNNSHNHHRAKKERGKGSKGSNNTKRTGNTPDVSAIHVPGVSAEKVEELRMMVLGQVGRPNDFELQAEMFVSLDCEMVGVGRRGWAERSVLARVSIVDYWGKVLLDELVKPQESVVNYRTAVTGLKQGDLDHAMPFSEVEQCVTSLLRDRVLVGHALHYDLGVLKISHPKKNTLDTQQLAFLHGATGQTPGLRVLVQRYFGISIQTGVHSSVTDARAALAIYRLNREKWDQPTPPRPPAQPKRENKDTKGKAAVKSGDNAGSVALPGSGSRKPRATGVKASSRDPKSVSSVASVTPKVVKSVGGPSVTPKVAKSKPIKRS